MAFEAHEGPEYVYEQLADFIEGQIRRGEIPPGAKLPGEQEMRRIYGSVALSTVRKALGLLRDRGLVVTRSSKGSFVVREIPPREPD